MDSEVALRSQSQCTDSSTVRGSGTVLLQLWQMLLCQAFFAGSSEAWASLCKFATAIPIKLHQQDDFTAANSSWCRFDVAPFQVLFLGRPWSTCVGSLGFICQTPGVHKVVGMTCSVLHPDDVPLPCPKKPGLWEHCPSAHYIILALYRTSRGVVLSC